jgi:hypothetical protein
VHRSQVNAPPDQLTPDGLIPIVHSELRERLRLFDPNECDCASGASTEPKLRDDSIVLAHKLSRLTGAHNFLFWIWHSHFSPHSVRSAHFKQTVYCPEN